MAAKKLNQVLAVEKTVKAKREDHFTLLYQNIQKPELTIGLSKTYQPLQENGEKFPQETRKVQVRIDEVLQQVVEDMREVFNVTAMKDVTNCSAVADVMVDGAVILKGVPATHLLWMEKKLLSFSDFINKLPVLPQDTVWAKDEAQGVYRSEPVSTVRTKKVEDFKPIFQPTDKHPGQYEKITKDENVGTWTTVSFSGAVPADRKKQLQERLEKFQKAVKEAREEANQTPVTELATGVIVERIFAP